jgi:dTDP-4-dehydrorhamnose reductase
MRVLVTGASGRLGAYLLEALAVQGHDVRGWSGRQPEERAGLTLLPVDLADPAALDRALAEADPDAVLHAAAMGTAEAVRRDPERARAVNVAASRQVAAWCGARGRRLVFTSTDVVFDGRGSWYREEEPAEPVLAYGRSKRDAERAVLEAHPGAVAARLSLLYGPSRWGREGFFDRELAALRRGEPRSYFTDEFRTPLDYRTAATILARLLTTDTRGVLHVGGPERLSRFALMARVAATLGIDPALVRGNRRAEALTEADEPRPADVSLDTERLALLLPGCDRPEVEAALAAS